MSADTQAKVRLFPGLIVFIGSFIIIFIALSLLDIVNNKYLLALIYSILVLILLRLLLMYKGIKEASSLVREGMIRYSMLCHNCNWEWMSNITEKNTPTKCPNCGEKSKLELIGYRRVQRIPKRPHKELTSFFNEK